MNKIVPVGPFARERRGDAFCRFDDFDDFGDKLACRGTALRERPARLSGSMTGFDDIGRFALPLLAGPAVSESPAWGTVPKARHRLPAEPPAAAKAFK
jgi:hypothetical protein